MLAWPAAVSRRISFLRLHFGFLGPCNIIVEFFFFFRKIRGLLIFNLDQWEREKTALPSIRYFVRRLSVFRSVIEARRREQIFLYFIEKRKED